jgi:hypothetical protein
LYCNIERKQLKTNPHKIAAFQFAIKPNKGSNMKNCLACLFLTLLLILSICVGQTQPQVQDILYLKNGSIVKGTIVELVPEKTVKIQTADDSISVYDMAEIEKIAKEQKPTSINPDQTSQTQSEQMLKSSSTHGGSGFTLFGGVSIPTGDLAATAGSKAGAAKTGFAVGADGSLALSPKVAWMSSVNLSVNSVDLSFLQNFGVSADAGSWTLVWAVTGLKVFGNVSPEVELYGFGQAGLLFGTAPQITLTVGPNRATQNSASATAFGFSFGAGINIRHVSLSVRYLSAEPEYSVTASGTGGTASGIIKQPTSCVAITGGIAF